MTGFLNDLGMDQVSGNANVWPDGNYPGFVFEAKIATSKNGDKALALKYKVAPEHPMAGREKDEWRPLPKMVMGPDGKATFAPDSRDKEPGSLNKMNAERIKQRIMSFGIPEERVTSINPSDLVGIPVTFTVKNKGEYSNVTFTKLREDASTGSVNGSPAVSATPYSTPVASTDLM